MTAVSVVIPTFKRPLLLRKCIQALLDQTLDPSLYEIIVVEDGGSAETEELVLAYATRMSAPRITYLLLGRKLGPAAARNLGWRSANADVIAFTDDDCIPERDWLARGLAHFAVPAVAGVSGRIIVPRSRRPTDYELNLSFLEHAEFATANCFYRRSALADVGGFDERFTAAWREDADLFFTLLRRGMLLLSAPDAIVIHPVRTGAWGVSIREQSKSVFNALLYKKHPALYRQRIKSPVLWYYYAIVVSGSLSLMTRAAGSSLSLLFVVAWALFTSLLCLRRLRSTSRAPGHVLEMLVTSCVNPFLSLFWRISGAIRYAVFFY